MTTSPPRDVPAVGALLFDATGRLLLVLRRNDPDRGTWSLPGGRVEPGEDPSDAVVREMVEETGLHVRATHLVARVTRPHPDGGRYVIDDFAVEWISGEPVAATDAAALGWFDLARLRASATTPGLIESLESWGLLPHSTDDAGPTPLPSL